MHINHLKRNIFPSIFLLALLTSSTTVFAKRPVPPSPEPDPIPTDPIPTGTTQQVSISSSGVQGNGHSYNKTISSDGRFVLFVSSSNNLVTGDTNLKNDIFLHDRLFATTQRVNLTHDGLQADNDSSSPSMSDDGRYIAFSSSAQNLLPGEQTFYSHIYVRDLVTGAIERVSVTSDGSLANKASYSSAISADGRYIAFSSFADNLVSGDTNAREDVFLHDRLNGTTQRISVSSEGTQGNHRSAGASISADGQTIAYLSSADNLVPNDTNNVSDIFVHHLLNGITERISINNQGIEANGWSGGPVVSDNGLVITFTSEASNLVSDDTNNYLDAFIHDLASSTTERVSIKSDGTQAFDDSYNESLSADGRYVVFSTFASNFDIGNVDWWYSDVFLHDRITKTTEIISLSTEGVQANEDSGSASVSADGRFVTFESYAQELVIGDNGSYTNDVFVRDRNPQ